MDVKAQEEWLPRPLIAEVNCTQIWNCKYSQSLSLKNVLHISTIMLKWIFPPFTFSITNKVAAFAEPSFIPMLCGSHAAKILMKEENSFYMELVIHMNTIWSCFYHVQRLDLMEAANRPGWKKSGLKDGLVFLMVFRIKKLIEYQLSMSFLPADMIFAQTSSDAFEASEYVGSGQGPSLRTHSTHLKPQQDTFENESLDWFSLYVS